MTDIAIARLLQDGTLDAEFGTNGVTVVTFSGNGEVPDIDLKLGATGRISVCCILGPARVGRVRLADDGTLDARPLASPALVEADILVGLSDPDARRIRFHTPVQQVIGGGGGAIGGGGVVQPAGAGAIGAGQNLAGDRILVAADVGEPAAPRFGVIAALTRDGAPDTGFSGDGQVTRGFAGEEIAVGAMAVDFRSGAVTLVAQGAINTIPLLQMLRFGADGAPDLSYGVNQGRPTADFPAEGVGTWQITPIDAATQNGEVFVLGSALNGGRSEIGVCHIRTNGGTDRAFGVDGGLGFGSLNQRPARAARLSLDGRGRPMIAVQSRQTMAVQRFGRDGRPDAGFGEGNTAFVDLGGAGGEARVARAVSGADERILVGGHAGHEFAVARLREDGAPDAGFGAGGVARFAPGGGRGAVECMAVDAQGRIVVAGTRSTIVID